MQIENEKINIFLDNQKSEEVQKILKDMPRWINRRGLAAVAGIVLLLVIGALYIKYPETYNSAFRNATFVSQTEVTDPASDIIVKIPVTPIIKQKQLIVLHLENEKNEIAGRITKIADSGENSLLYIQFDNPGLMNTLKNQTNHRAISGTLEIIVRYKNLFNLLFKR